jgi:hypothetical protein
MTPRGCEGKFKPIDLVNERAVEEQASFLVSMHHVEEYAWLTCHCVVLL